MVEETGKVFKIEGDYVWISTNRKSACQNCGANKTCGSGLLSRVIPSKQINFKIKNTLNVKSGEEVIIGIEDHLLVSASLAVYLLPLFGLMIGALFGEIVASSISWNKEFSSIFLGLLGLTAGFLGVRKILGRQSLACKMQPVLIRKTDFTSFMG